MALVNRYWAVVIGPMVLSKALLVVWRFRWRFRCFGWRFWWFDCSHANSRIGDMGTLWGRVGGFGGESSRPSFIPKTVPRNNRGLVMRKTIVSYGQSICTQAAGGRPTRRYGNTSE